MAVLVGVLALGCDARAPVGRAPVPSPPAPGAPERADPAPRPPPPPAAAARPRLGALDVEVYVRQSPRERSPEIGVLTLGTEVARSERPVSHSGCPGGWYPVEPEGYVCHGRVTTLEPDQHPMIQAKREVAGPHRYFESAGEAPLYRKLPSRSEQRRSEPALERHLERLEPSSASGELPPFLRDHALSPWALVHTPGDLRPRVKFVPARSTIAATHELGFEGRSFLVSSELLLVPRDRLRELTPSDFSGVPLDGKQRRLPIAFVRGEPRPKFRLADGMQPTGESFPRLAALELTGRTLTRRSTSYLETSAGDWIREADATVVREQPPRGFELAPGEKWIDVHIFKGTLVAYQGDRAVFATLISPGAHGYRRQDGRPARFTTPTGSFRLEWKHRSTTMTPDPERMSYYLAEVPHTQFFHMPFALHAAYWHDRFGEPKSGGCVNLSPSDARWLFEWTEPHVPDGWHGVRSGGARGPGTWVRVR
jgi:hypothetical protein